MTDRAYRAKNWLMRTGIIEDERKRQRSKLLLLGAKVNNCVTNYYSCGHSDSIVSRAAHEDLIMDYSNACAEYENLMNKIGYENNTTLKYINRLIDFKFRLFLYDRFINHLTIEEMAKLKRYDIKKRQLFILQNEALEAFGRILESKPPEIVPNINQGRTIKNIIPSEITTD